MEKMVAVIFVNALITFVTSKFVNKSHNKNFWKNLKIFHLYGPGFSWENLASSGYNYWSKDVQHVLMKEEDFVNLASKSQEILDRLNELELDLDIPKDFQTEMKEKLFMMETKIW